jgi:hypothetical protein
MSESLWVSFLPKRKIHIADDREKSDLSMRFTVICAFGGLHSAVQNVVSDHQMSKFETSEIVYQLRQKVFLIQFGVQFHDTS